MQLNSSWLSVFRSAIAVVSLVFAFNAASLAQIPIPTDSPQKEEKLAPLEEEMRIRREISHAQKQHKENLNRAEELSCLGAEIGTTFKAKNHLDRADLKKLDKLEKLTKSIRNAAGGSHQECQMEEIPNDLPAIISKMAEYANSLREQVDKTPRQVVSTTVIDQANVLLELIRRVRDLSGKT